MLKVPSEVFISIIAVFNSYDIVVFEFCQQSGSPEEIFLQAR